MCSVRVMASEALYGRDKGSRRRHGVGVISASRDLAGSGDVCRAYGLSIRTAALYLNRYPDEFSLMFFAAKMGFGVRSLLGSGSLTHQFQTDTSCQESDKI